MGSVSLDKISVGQTTARFSCRAWGWPYPSDEGTTTEGDSKNGSTTTISYSNTIWSWSFSDGGSASTKLPTHTFTGLTPGTINLVKGTLSVSCTRTVTIKTWTTDEKGNTTSNTKELPGEKRNLGSASDSKPVYTQPTAWSFGCHPGDYIANYATKAKWNRLIDLVGKYKSWELGNNYYHAYDHLKVSSGDWITAKLYNDVADVCKTSRVTADKTIISAALFEALANAVSP